MKTTSNEASILKVKSVGYSQTEPSNGHGSFIKSSKTSNSSMFREKALKTFNILTNNVSNPRYLGFSEYQSENSLQNSSYCWSFPKENRFNSTKSLTDKIYILPQMTSTRSTNMGIGLRKDLRPKPGAFSPPPNAYHIKSCFDWNLRYKKGIKLGEKCDNKHDTNKSNPGPGAYTVASKQNKLLIPITIKSRQGFFYDEDLKKSKHSVSMQKYHPNDVLERNLRFTKITFGIGKRTPNENLFVKSNPGPGSYQVAGCLEKGLKKKLMLN